MPRAAGPFNYPSEMVADPAGDLYVSDGYRNARVHRFAADGRLLHSWGEPGSGPGQFHLPHGIALDRRGVVLRLTQAGLEARTTEVLIKGSRGDLGLLPDLHTSTDYGDNISAQVFYRPCWLHVPST